MTMDEKQINRVLDGIMNLLNRRIHLPFDKMLMRYELQDTIQQNLEPVKVREGGEEK